MLERTGRMAEIFELAVLQHEGSIVAAAQDMRDFIGPCTMGYAHFVGDHRIENLAALLIDCSRCFEGDPKTNLNQIIRFWATSESPVRALGSVITGQVFSRAMIMLESQLALQPH